MKTIHRLIDFLMYSNSVIGWVGVGLVFILAKVNGSAHAGHAVLLFIFSLIVCLYGWLKYKESRDGGTPATTHRQWFLANYPVAAVWMIINAILVFVLTFRLPKSHQFAVGLLAFFSIFYVFDFKYSVRRLALLKPFYVALIWTLLVVLMTQNVWVQWSAGLVYTTTLLFLLFSILLLLFEIKDQGTDLANRLTTWPIKFGLDRTKTLAFTLAFVLLIIAAWGCFSLTEYLSFSIAIIVQSLTLFPLIHFTHLESSDCWYFLVLDGSLLLLPLSYFLIT